MDHLDINREGWNRRTAIHIDSDFYDMPSFLAGKTSLKEIELPLLGDLEGKTVLHLQCHFGQDSISLAKMGAQVTAVDLSPDAIAQAEVLAEQMGVHVEFICSDVLAQSLLDGRQFDMVFASYGTIPWLPDLKPWARLIHQRLKVSGRLVFVEFHPVLDLFDDDMEKMVYSYFNVSPIQSQISSYAQKDSEDIPYVVWNHPFGEILSALLEQGLRIAHFQEYDFSPYPCFRGMIPAGEGRYVIERFGHNLPYCFSIVAEK
ncbi:MAG: class I SAM-dependent methyltransferase [Flavobacteriales bacterium]|nr:class I SAM-dependent methyltransferase [Flavobacteriales bacterium]